MCCKHILYAVVIANLREFIRLAICRKEKKINIIVVNMFTETLKSAIIIENEYFTINPLATAIAKDLILNKNKFNPPNETSEFETFWNSMSNGVFDIVTEENKAIYTSFYPNLIK